MEKTFLRLVHVGGLALLLAFVPFSRAGTYFQDFTSAAVGTTNLGDGSTLFSSHPGSAAQVVDAAYKELQLTASGTTSTRTAFRLPSLDPAAPSYAFSAKWNATITANFPEAGDGWSFNYGALGTTDLISPSYFQPDGYTNGISFGIRTYFGNNPAFYLRVNGGVAASLPFNPQTQWGLNSNTRHFFEVDWNYTNGVTVRVDGQTIFSNVAVIGFAPAANDRFVFAARTSVFTEEVRLDNMAVVTGGTLSSVTSSAPYFADANVDAGNPASMAFDGNPGTYWVTHATSGQVGATVPSSSVLVYAVTSPDIANTTQFGRTWTLEGSNNNGTNWAACGTGSTPFINSRETRCWLATNQNAFSAYRLNVTQNNGNNFVTALGEVRLYKLNPVSAVGWQALPSPYDVRWKTIATSVDGTKIIAAGNPGGVYVSTNSGLSWVQAPMSVALWTAAACSSNGNIMAVAAPFDPERPQYSVYGVYFSTNTGASWTKANVTDSLNWRTLSMNADGSSILAGVHGGAVWRDTPNNTPWQQIGVPANASWGAAATSDSGIYNYFATENGLVYAYDYIFGSSLSLTMPATTWAGVAVSGDGSKAIATTDDAYIQRYHFSSGWIPVAYPNVPVKAMAASADLSKVSLANNNNIYLSTNGGTNWAALNPPNVGWTSVTLSRDGTRLYATGATLENRQVWVYGPFLLARPGAVTAGGSFVSTRGAQINGSATPLSLPTTAYFQWGITTNYGNTTAPQSMGNGLYAQPLGAALSLLQPQTTYHFRTVAWNVFGTNCGADVTFTTAGVNLMNLMQIGDSVVASSPNFPGEQTPAQAFDGVAFSKYLNLDKTNTFLTLYPSLTNLPVAELGLISAEDAPERDPASFALYGSTDGVNFTLIASNAIPPFLDRMSIQTIPIASANAYSVYRLHFPTVANESAANSMQIAEIELRPYRQISRTNDGISVTSNAGPIAGAPLIDHRLYFFHNIMHVGGGTGSTEVRESLATGPSVLKGLEIITGEPGQFGWDVSPASVTIYGSTNGLDYTLMASNTLPLPTAGWQATSVPVANTNAYAHYRFDFHRYPGAYGLFLAELRLFGVAPAELSPRLSLQRIGTNVVVTWPDAPGFQLERAAQVGLPSWTVVTNPPSQANLTNAVTLPAHGPMEFYRLRK